MKEKYILLTGGHSGIGLSLTKSLLKPGNKLGLIIRNEARKNEALMELCDFPTALVDEIDFFFADLGDQQQVRLAAMEIKNKWPRVDRLFNNAAIVSPVRKKSKQGNEMHLEVNALAHILLTQELKPLLLNSNDATVITTVTGGMNRRKLRIDQILNDDYKGMMLYAQSKQAVMLLMNDLAASWDSVKFFSVNPGTNKTKMSTGDEAPIFMKFIAHLFFNEPEYGAQRLYNAAFDPRFSAENRAYITGDKVVAIKYGLTAQDKTALLAGIRS